MKNCDLERTENKKWDFDRTKQIKKRDLERTETWDIKVSDPPSPSLRRDLRHIKFEKRDLEWITSSHMGS